MCGTKSTYSAVPSLVVLMEKGTSFEMISLVTASFDHNDFNRGRLVVSRSSTYTV
jgi:hypothetical protein